MISLKVFRPRVWFNAPYTQQTPYDIPFKRGDDHRNPFWPKNAPPYEVTASPCNWFGHDMVDFRTNNKTVFCIFHTLLIDSIVNTLGMFESRR